MVEFLVTKVHLAHSGVIADFGGAALRQQVAQVHDVDVIDEVKENLQPVLDD